MNAPVSLFVDTAPETQSEVKASAKRLPRPSRMALALGTAKPVDAVAILERVAARFGVTNEQLQGIGRSSKVANARHAAAWVLYQHGLSTTEVGREIGYRDHTTICNSLKRIEKERAESEAVRRELDALAGMILAEDVGEREEEP